MTKKYQSEAAQFVCKSCGAKNPLTAYCCLSCFRVLRPPIKKPFFAFSVRPSYLVVAVAAFIIYGGLVITKKWIDSIEARIDMNLKSNDFNVRITADKKKSNASVSIESEMSETNQTQEETSADE